jgi:hypothetical protein
MTRWAEATQPRSPTVPGFAIGRRSSRISDFGLLSGLGLRVSAFWVSAPARRKRRIHPPQNRVPPGRCIGCECEELRHCLRIVLLLPSCSPLILLLFRPPARHGLWGPVRPCHRGPGRSQYRFDRARVVSIHRKFNFPTRAPTLECRRSPDARTARIAYAKAGNYDVARAGP